MRAVCALLGAVIGFGLCGCGKPDPYKRYPVTVTVTLDGKPMPDGRVQFYAVDGRGTSGVDVTNGTAKFESVAGMMKVEFGVYRLPPGMAPPPKNSVLDFRENILPERYHSKSDLTAEVKADGSNEFTFELKTK